MDGKKDGWMEDVVEERMEVEEGVEKALRTGYKPLN
jgi:hypothetical protein